LAQVGCGQNPLSNAIASLEYCRGRARMGLLDIDKVLSVWSKFYQVIKRRIGNPFVIFAIKCNPV
jgi:hypothetical protein